MVLADTSIWVDHLRSGDDGMERALLAGEVIGHSLVTGEIAMGSLRDRADILGRLAQLPPAVRATDEEAIALIEHARLFALGMSFIDAHLLASALLTPGTTLWTRDRRLRAAAERLGVGDAQD